MNRNIKNILVCSVTFIVVVSVLFFVTGVMRQSLAEKENQRNETQETNQELNSEINQEINKEINNETNKEINNETNQETNQEVSTESNQETNQETNQEASTESINQINQQTSQEKEQEANQNTQKDNSAINVDEVEIEETIEPAIEETIIPTNENEPSKTGKIVAIDAGHQLVGNSEKEPNGPGSTVMKAKVTSGATGVSSKVQEYVLNLEVSLKLKEELKKRGYEVVMIRETHDVNLSNAERAAIANDSADIFIRIHANGADDASVEGALTISPSENNEYVGYMAKECKQLSQAVIDGLCDATGAKNRGVLAMDNMSGINWCTIPVTIVEMGYLSNPKEDERMQEEEYQQKIAKGIADGVDTYFAE